MPALVFPAPGFSTSTRFVNTITESVSLVSLGNIKSRVNLRETPSIANQLRTAKISSTMVLRPIAKTDKILDNAVIFKRIFNIKSSTNLSTSTNRIEAQYTQTSVVVTGKPTNARENLYYFNLAPGLRSNRTIVQGFQFASTNLSTSTNGSITKLKTILTTEDSTSTGVIVKLKIPSNNNCVFFEEYAPDRIEAQYTQTSVVVTGKPTNARENLYYFNLAPGLRSNRTIVQGLSYTEVNDNRDLPYRIEAQYTQTSVVVTGKPTNARENLYYFNLAPGLRSNRTIVQGTNFVEVNDGRDLAYSLQKQLLTLRSLTDQRVTTRIEAQYTQTSVVVTGAPTNARENLYYFNLAPGLRSNRTIVQGLSYVGIANESISLDPGKLSSFAMIKSPGLVPLTYSLDNYYDQASVSITGAPTNARENLYYFNLAPGLRSNRTIVQGLSYTEVNDGRDLAYSLQKQLIALKSSDTLPITVNELSASQKVRGIPTEIYTRDVLLLDRFKFSYDKSEVFDTVVSLGNLQKQLQVLKFSDTLTIGVGKLSASRVVRSGDTLPITISKLSASQVVKEIATSQLLSNVYAIDRLTLPYNLTEVFDTVSSGNLQKQLQLLKTGDTLPITISKLSAAQVVRSMPSDAYTFEVTAIDRLTLPYNLTEVFDTVSSGNLQKQLQLLKTGDTLPITISELSASRVVRSGDTLPITISKLSASQVVRSMPSDAYTFEVTAIDRLKLPYINAEIFDTISSGNLQKQLQVLRSNDTLSIDVANLSQQSLVIKSLPANVNASIIGDYYDQFSVSTTGQPRNARETYYYFNIAPGLRSNRSIVQGTLYTDFNTVNTSGNLSKQSLKLTAISREGYILSSGKVGSTAVLRATSESLNISNLNKQLLKLTSLPYEGYTLKISKVGSTVALTTLPQLDDLGKLRSTTVLRPALLRNRGGLIDFIARPIGLQTDYILTKIYDLPNPKIPNMSVMLFFIAGTDGQIVRLKTGSKAIQDPAAPKKEPIQFWN